MTARDIDAIVRSLCILISAYEPETEPIDLEKVDSASYTAGFRAGARSAYSDVVCRLRESRAELADVTRIGAGA